MSTKHKTSRVALFFVLLLGTVFGLVTESLFGIVKPIGTFFTNLSK